MEPIVSNDTLDWGISIESLLPLQDSACNSVNLSLLSSVSFVDFMGCVARQSTVMGVRSNLWMADNYRPIGFKKAAIVFPCGKGRTIRINHVIVHVRVFNQVLPEGRLCYL